VYAKRQGVTVGTTAAESFMLVRSVL
jgi:hypothetical protein